MPDLFLIWTNEDYAWHVNMHTWLHFDMRSKPPSWLTVVRGKTTCAKLTTSVTRSCNSLPPDWENPDIQAPCTCLNKKKHEVVSNVSG
ncbi:hypothetical protein POUND7_006983 [Theobroma cacao]